MWGRSVTSRIQLPPERLWEKPAEGEQRRCVSLPVIATLRSDDVRRHRIDHPLEIRAVLRSLRQRKEYNFPIPTQIRGLDDAGSPARDHEKTCSTHVLHLGILKDHKVRQIVGSMPVSQKVRVETNHDRTLGIGDRTHA